MLLQETFLILLKLDGGKPHSDNISSSYHPTLRPFTNPMPPNLHPHPLPTISHRLAPTVVSIQERSSHIPSPNFPTIGHSLNTLPLALWTIQCNRTFTPTPSPLYLTGLHLQLKLIMKNRWFYMGTCALQSLPTPILLPNPNSQQILVPRGLTPSRAHHNAPPPHIRHYISSL